jgi:hypothetical protein
MMSVPSSRLQEESRRAAIKARGLAVSRLKEGRQLIQLLGTFSVTMYSIPVSMNARQSAAVGRASLNDGNERTHQSVSFPQYLY